MLAAIAGVLMSLEISMPMMPVFYKIDFSDVPTIIAVFMMGPFAGFCVEIIKILIKLITVGTNSMFVGEFANLIGAFLFVFPISFIYKKLGKNMRAAAVALVISIPIRVAMSCFINAFITLPMYAAAMGLPLDDIVRMVAAVNPKIQNLTGFIVMATIPFNIIKNTLNCLIGYALLARLRKHSSLMNFDDK